LLFKFFCRWFLEGPVQIMSGCEVVVVVHGNYMKVRVGHIEAGYCETDLPGMIYGVHNARNPSGREKHLAIQGFAQILEMLFMRPGDHEDVTGIDRISVHEGDDFSILVNGIRRKLTSGYPTKYTFSNFSVFIF